MLTNGVTFGSLSFLYFPPRKLFSLLIYSGYLLIFDPGIFYPREVGDPNMLPYGITFESLFFLCHPRKTFLGLNLQAVSAYFDHSVF